MSCVHGKPEGAVRPLDRREQATTSVNNLTLIT